MKKESYQTIEWELVLFDGKDVITDSDEGTVRIDFDEIG